MIDLGAKMSSKGSGCPCYLHCVDSWKHLLDQMESLGVEGSVQGTLPL